MTPCDSQARKRTRGVAVSEPHWHLRARPHERAAHRGPLHGSPRAAHFGIGCLKFWIRGSLRYPDEAVENGNDGQYHAYAVVRVKAKNSQVVVRVVHAHVEDYRIMEDSRVVASDIAAEGFVANVNGAAQ